MRLSQYYQYPLQEKLDGLLGMDVFIAEYLEF